MGNVHSDNVGIANHSDDDGKIDGCEGADNTEYCVLLTALDVRDADQFSRAAEISARSGRDHLGDSLAAPNECTGVGGALRRDLDWD